MVFYVVAHSSDPDGIVYHALVKKLAETRSLGETHHFFSDYSEHPQRGIKATLDVLTKLTDVESGDLYVGDLDCSSNLSSELIQQLGTRHRTAKWHDHHGKTRKRKAELEAAGFIVKHNAGTCAARLLFKSDFSTTDPYLQRLSDLAQVHDYENTNNHLWSAAEQLEEAINCGMDLQQLVDDLAEGRVFNPGFTGLVPGYAEEILIEYLMDVAQAIQKLEVSYEVLEIGGKRFAFAPCDGVLFMKRSQRELKRVVNDRRWNHGKVDYGVVLPEGINNCLIEAYGTGNKRSVQPFCEELGGGGRQHRGGFPLPAEVFRANVIDKVGFLTPKVEAYTPFFT